MSSGTYYHKVFVALISWKNHDLVTETIDIDDELDIIEHFCSHEYDFSVTRIQIPNDSGSWDFESYGAWLTEALENFYGQLEKETGDKEKGEKDLVMIWYNGHGGYNSPEDKSLWWYSGSFQPMIAQPTGSETPGEPISAELNWNTVWDEVRLGVDPDLDHLFILDCCEGQGYSGEGISQLMAPGLLRHTVGEVSPLTSYHVILAADSDKGQLAYTGSESLSILVQEQLGYAMFKRGGRPNPDGLTIEEMLEMMKRSSRSWHEPTHFVHGSHGDGPRWIRVPPMSGSDEDPSENNDNQESEQVASEGIIESEDNLEDEEDEESDNDDEDSDDDEESDDQETSEDDEDPNMSSAYSGSEDTDDGVWPTSYQ